MRRDLSALLLSAAVLLTVCGCREKQPSAPRAADVLVAKAGKASYTEYTPSVSNVQAFDTVQLVARVKGFLRKCDFSEGGVYKKDTVLFQIEPEQYEADVKSAEADLLKARASRTNAETEFNRQKQLLEKNASSQRNYDDAESTKLQADADVLSAEAKLENAKLNLEYTRIKAPFDGIISFKNYSEGNLVGPDSGTLATFHRTGPVKVDFRLNELDMLKLMKHRSELRKTSKDENADVEIQLYFQNGEKYRLAGKIYAFDNQVNRNTGTFNIRAVFENPDGELVPGMHVRILVQTSPVREMLAIPAGAVMSDMQGDYVYTVDSKNLVSRRNITAAKDRTTAYVSEGLKEGEIIVTDGINKVRPGSLVNPKEAAAAKPSK